LPFRRRLRFEPLEDRRLLANVTVGNTNDVVNGTATSIAALIATPGADGISLREAILAANADAAADTIDFSVTGTIQLTDVGHAGEVVISDHLTINGPGASVLTVQAFNPSATLGDGERIFNVDDGSATLKVVTVSGLTLTGGDTASGYGGGAILNFENLTITDCAISDNNSGTATVTTRGGGIYNRGGDLVIADSAVSGNTSRGRGGGIYSRLGSLSIIRSTISGNEANAAVGGGGLYGNASTITIDSSTISGNTAGTGGGFGSAGDGTITNSTISGNSAALGGGGIFVGSGSVTVRHSTITLNRADSDNNASGTGGGLSGPATLDHTIVAGNLRSVSTRDDISGTLAASSAYNLIGVDTGLTGISNGTNGNQIGTGAAPIDALLGPLAANGGPTLTHQLLVGSPAIDMGDPAVPSPPTNDQRGAPFARVADGDGAGGARIDMGAYERQTLAASFLIVDTVSDERDGDYSAGDLSLREAIDLSQGSIGPDTITFDAALSGATITLGGTELVIGEALTIDARPLAANVTIDANQLSRIFNITATTGDFTLGGLTLTGGRTTATSIAGRGGAIRSFTTGNLTLDQSTVSGNSTAGDNAYGGGINARAVTLTQSTVSGNSTAGVRGHGGGIYSNGAVTLTQSTVSGNSTAGQSADGGGMYSKGTVTLSQSTVSGNSTAGQSADGGGISSLFAVTLAESTVSGNSTAGQSADGGGIHSKGTVTLSQSTVSGNSTSGDSADGGGIFAYGAVTLAQSTVTENQATHATATSGGVFQYDTVSNHPLSISGSIVAGNTAGGGGADLAPDPQSTLTVNYSLIGVAPAGMVGIGNITGLDPLLGPLANNGGPTMTHALLAGSPAIDAGDPNFDPEDPDGDPQTDDVMLFDQRGAPFVRVLDGNGAGGAQIDIGATEFVPTDVLHTLFGDYNQDGTVNGPDYTEWRNTVNSGVAAYHAADGSGNSVVDIDDFRVWKSFYGRTVPVIGSGGGSLVPQAEGNSANDRLQGSVAPVSEEITPPLAQLDEARHRPPHQGEGENPRGALDVRSEVGRYAGAKTLTPGPSPGGRGEQDVRGEALLALFERERMAVPFDAKCGDEFEISRESEDVESEAAIEGVDAVFDLLAAGI
jgi:predicted outer membrane repeat protein